MIPIYRFMHWLEGRRAAWEASKVRPDRIMGCAECHAPVPVDVGYWDANRRAVLCSDLCSQGWEDTWAI